MTTDKKTFDADEAVNRIKEGKTVHCLATDETITKAKTEGALKIDLAIGKNVSRMPVENFLGTYAKARFADGPVPATTAK